MAKRKPKKLLDVTLLTETLDGQLRFDDSRMAESVAKSFDPAANKRQYLLRRMTNDQKHEILRLHEAIRQAREQFTGFVYYCRLTPGQFTKDYING